MSHISYSELKEWTNCPWKHKLNYIEKINQFKGNEHTAFGTALHLICEVLVEKTHTPQQIEDLKDYFEQKFLENLKDIKNNSKDISFSEKLISDMREQGKYLIKFIQ